MPFGVRTFLEGFTSATAWPARGRIRARPSPMVPARAQGRSRARHGEPRDIASGRGNRLGSDLHAVRRLLRAPAPAAVGRGRRGAAPAGRARPGRARRPARLRRRVGGRAPLPRGVLALVRLRGVPRGLLAAHAEHPAWLRHRRDTARLPAPRARGREGRDARPGLARAGGLRFGRDLERCRARRLRRRPRDQAPAVGRGARRRHPHVRGGAVRRLRRPLPDHAQPQRHPQAQAEAPPAAMGGVLAPRDDPPRGREGHRRAVVLVRRARGGARSGSTSTTRSSPRTAACPPASRSIRTSPSCCR